MTEMPKPLSDEWVSTLAAASSDRVGVGMTGVVAITIGKTRRAVLEIVDGRVVVSAAEPDSPVDGSPVDGSTVDGGAEVAVTIPATAKQLDAIIDGSESLAQAFMRGDIKPEGATGALLAAIELFEDATFRSRLVAHS